MPKEYDYHYIHENQVLIHYRPGELAIKVCPELVLLDSSMWLMFYFSFDSDAYCVPPVKVDNGVIFSGDDEQLWQCLGVWLSFMSDPVIDPVAEQAFRDVSDLADFCFAMSTRDRMSLMPVAMGTGDDSFMLMGCFGPVLFDGELQPPPHGIVVKDYSLPDGKEYLSREELAVVSSWPGWHVDDDGIHMSGDIFDTEDVVVFSKRRLLSALQKCRGRAVAEIYQKTNPLSSSPVRDDYIPVADRRTDYETGLIIVDDSEITRNPPLPLVLPDVAPVHEDIRKFLVKEGVLGIISPVERRRRAEEVVPYAKVPRIDRAIIPVEQQWDIPVMYKGMEDYQW